MYKPFTQKELQEIMARAEYLADLKVIDTAWVIAYKQLKDAVGWLEMLTVLEKAK